jgi:hypothetical protein
MNKDVEKHLKDPYNRIKYAYHFLGTDKEMNAKCMEKIYYYLSQEIDCEVHY